jgi:DNA-directed RNA polymerase specialized sigma24 family protein
LEEKAGNAATEQKRNLFQSRGVMPREQQMEVLERFALGDLEAFEILFREFQGEVYRCTYRIVRDAVTAEDLTVEAFCISIASSKPSLREIAASPNNNSANLAKTSQG